jgi:hypothetical protein
MSKRFRDRVRNPQLQLRLLLLLAAIWHVAFATAVYEIGKHQIAPNLIYSNGGLAGDGAVYAPQLVELCSIMKNEGPRAWLGWPTQLHVRLYSLPLMLFTRGTEFNVLTIEPLNLLYFLCIIGLVFKIGESVFDRSVGLLAAIIVSLWPSLVLHTTQLLRDPLLIIAFLTLVWSIIQIFQAGLSWRRTLLLVLTTSVSVVVIRIVRLPMWPLLWAIVPILAGLLIARFVRERRIDRAAAAFAVALFIIALIVPRFQPLFHNQQELRRRRTVVPEEVQKLPVEKQIATRRTGFQFRIDEAGNLGPADGGSAIDADVTFRGAGDMVRYLPRAIAIGFFAPFPNMWFTAGRQVGTSGRLISGFETLLTYGIECLALIGIWSARRKFAVWFLVSIAALGIIALGLIVNNIGALYRLRYPFWILLVILGAGGLVRLLAKKPSGYTRAQKVNDSAGLGL